MGEAGLLIKPPTSKAAIEALQNIRRLRPQAILLNLPVNIEVLLNSYSKGEIGYDDLQESLYELLPEPAGAWIKEFNVLLRELPSIGELTDVYCYIDGEAFNREASASIEIAILTIRSIIRERIDVKEWVKALEKSILGDAEKWDRMILKIIDIAESYDRVACISGFEGKYIKRRLERAGISSWMKYLGQPYHFTPLEILKRFIMLDRVDEELFERLIREHIRFLREYVYNMSYTEAVEKWVGERLYWLPARRQKSE